MHDILADGLDFPEGPVILPGGIVWGVELCGGGLFRCAGGAIVRIPTGGEPNGLAACGASLWFCDAGAGAIRTIEVGETPHDILASGEGTVLERPNDLAFDAAGNLVFTCPGDSRTRATGTVWARTPEGDILRVRDGMMFPNGIAFTPSGAELIVAETYARRLWRGAWDVATCRWISPTPWIDLPGPIGPDGMAFSTDGHLFVALYGKGSVAMIDPSGSVVAMIATPGERPTNVALDPDGLLGLVVTEAERGELLSYPEIRHLPALFGTD